MANRNESTVFGSFMKSPPEQVIEWRDEMTQAVGWLAINARKNSVCGGGIRMQRDLEKGTVIDLAKSMSLKFSQLSPLIGGAKGGIRYDPAKADKAQVLERFVSFIKPRLMADYGTGGDLNISEAEIIRAMDANGIPHPQYGIAMGLAKVGLIRDGKNAVEKLRKGVMLPHEKGILMDFATGKGVAEAARAACKGGLKGKRAIIQGFGNVGGGVAKYLHEAGAKVVGVSDEICGLADPEGLDVPALLRSRVGGRRLNLEEAPKRAISMQREGI
ncbi:MAG: Glu/Leu/Phe/Val dehydrogenase dimerization domain-containing protein, partial [Candidatus Micrarchaeota archaeon]